MHLAGSPSLPWVLRFNLSCTPLCQASDCLMLMLAFSLWLVCGSDTPPAGRTYLACISAACLLSITWRRASTKVRHGGSYATWRELPVALFKASLYGFGAGAALVRAYLDTAALPAVTSGGAMVAWHAALMVSAARLEGMLLLWATKPIRIGFAVPVHVALLAFAMRSNHDMCDAVVLRDTRVAWHTHEVLSLLSSLRCSILPFAEGTERVLPPVTECTVVLTYLQMALGFVLPAAVHAAIESRLFVAHQLERQQLGMEAEAGPQARMYAALCTLFSAADAPVAAVHLYLLLGVLYDVAVLLCIGPRMS